MALNTKIKKTSTFIHTFFMAQGHLGELEKKTNIYNFKYILGARNNIHIWDLDKTIPVIRQTLFVLKNILKQKGIILFLGSPGNKLLNNQIKITASVLKQPFIITKWIGGLFTNWEVTHKNLQNLNFKNKNKIIKQKKYFSLLNLTTKPDILFVFDVKKNAVAIKEANKLNIPVVALVDTDINPNNITYPIFCNDDSIPTATLLCKILTKLAK